MLIAEYSYSTSEDFDGNDDETPTTIYFTPLTNEDTIEANEDFDIEHNKIHQQITNASFFKFVVVLTCFFT